MEENPQIVNHEANEISPTDNDNTEAIHTGSSIPSEYECTICMKLLVAPITTSCGHTFCQACLERARSVRPVCPLCREPLHGGRRPNIALMNLIQRDFPITYQQRETELASQSDLHQMIARQRHRSNSVVILPLTDESLLKKFECRFPGEVIVFHTSNDEMIRKLRLARGSGEIIGVLVNSLASMALMESVLYGVTARIEELHIGMNDYNQEVFVKVSINGRWEKAIEELGERQLSDDDLVVVNSFYDENWDDNNINELKIKYCELSEKLNDEIRKQFIVSGVAGENTFRRLFGSVPDPSNQQNLNGEQVELNSFFYARVFRFPLEIRYHLFHLRNSLQRMEDVLNYINFHSGAYSLLNLTEEGELPYSSHLDSMMNRAIVIGSVALLSWVIYQIVSFFIADSEVNIDEVLTLPKSLAHDKLFH